MGLDLAFVVCATVFSSYDYAVTKKKKKGDPFIQDGKLSALVEVLNM